MKNSEAILVTPKQFEIQECPVPEPKDHEILMKVEYVGMCGSDIHGFEFGPFIPPKDPNQKIGLGHEVAGEVVKVGSKVTRFKAGDKVLIEPGVPDDKCEYCRTGRYNICPDVDFMATQPNYKGALTQQWKQLSLSRQQSVCTQQSSAAHSLVRALLSSAAVQSVLWYFRLVRASVQQTSPLLILCRIVLTLH